MIPFTAPRSPDGRPELGRIDADNAMLCADLDLCGVCGQPLGPRRVLLATSALLGTTEPPMHAGCAQLALRRCPHLRENVGAYWLATSVRHALRDGGRFPEWSFDPDEDRVRNARTGKRWSEPDVAAAADADYWQEQQQLAELT